MVAYLDRMPVGFPGDVTRQPAPGDITQGQKNMTYAWSIQSLGTAVVLDGTGLIAPVSSTTTASNIYGFLVRSFPGQGESGSGPNGATGTYPIGGQIAGVMRRGYIAVALQNQASASKGGAVYIRIANNTKTLLLGGVEAAADGANTILLPGAMFEGAAGIGGVVEISFLLPIVGLTVTGGSK